MICKRFVGHHVGASLVVGHPSGHRRVAGGCGSARSFIILPELGRRLVGLGGAKSEKERFNTATRLRGRQVRGTAGTVKGSEPTFHDPRRGNGSNVRPAHHCLQARALQFWEHGQMRAAVARPLLPFFLSWASLSSRPPAAGNIIAVFLSHDSLIRLRTARELEISSRQAHDHRQSPLPSPVPILF